jgi:hypothetical protein
MVFDVVSIPATKKSYTIKYAMPNITYNIIKIYLIFIRINRSIKA